MKITAVFDSYAPKIGQKINSLTVQPMEELSQTIRDQGIRIGIITVPDSEAQNVADILVESGIEAILNFAPAILKTPATIRFMLPTLRLICKVWRIIYMMERKELQMSSNKMIIANGRFLVPGSEKVGPERLYDYRK